MTVHLSSLFIKTWSENGVLSVSATSKVSRKAWHSHRIRRFQTETQAIPCSLRCQWFSYRLYANAVRYRRCWEWCFIISPVTCNELNENTPCMQEIVCTCLVHGMYVKGTPFILCTNHASLLTAVDSPRLLEKKRGGCLYLRSIIFRWLQTRGLNVVAEVLSFRPDFESGAQPDAGIISVAVLTSSVRHQHCWTTYKNGMCMIQVSCDNGTISTFPRYLDTAVNCVRILDGKFNSVQWPTEIFGCCRQYTSSYPPMMICVYRSCLRTTKHLLVGIVVSRKSTSWWTGNFHGTFRISSFLQSVNETLNSRHAPFKPLLVTAICIVLLNGLCLRVTKDAHKSAGIICSLIYLEKWYTSLIYTNRSQQRTVPVSLSTRSLY